MTHRIKKLFNQVISALSIYLLAVQPVLAQAIVAAEGGPDVIQAANGTTMVMIAVPDANGVSHNVYVEFSVGPDGAILNNVDTNITLTELAGQVQGNSNLAGGAATVILNEVTGNLPSTMTGYLEVAGQRADVIIANPYGITCDGCGFINTDALTMSTGTPTYESGTFTGLSVNDGAINIGANGLDAGDTTRFDLISRQISVAGAVQGHRIRIVAGRNDVIYATGEVIEKADDGSAKPALAIDSTVLGGMYADAITITSTEDGVGVRAPTNMAANAGAMTITADGRLVMASASASGNITINSSDDVVIEGTVVASQNVNITTAEDLILEANAALIADSIADLTIGNNLTLEAGAELAAGSNIDASVTGAVRVASAANFISNGTFSMVADSIDNAGTIAATGGALTLQTINNMENNGGLIFGDTSTNLRSNATILNNGGTIMANGNLSIRGRTGASANRFTNQNGGLLETISGNITIAALTFENLRADPTVDGTVVSDSTDLTGESCVPNCDAVIGNSVTHDGEAAQIISAGDITLVGNTLSNRYSLISARGNIALTANSLENIGLNIYQDTGSGLQLIGAVFGTIEAAGTLSGVIGYVQNASVLDAVSGIVATGEIGAGDSGSIGNPALLVTNVDPNAAYLIETRPGFVDLDQFISSDYFLEIIKYDPELKRFGDAYAEALYIRQQLLALLGQLILTAGIDERAQIQAMYDNAIDAMVNLDLTVGVALTPTQISALTTDIIWMEEVVINGQRVLAPRVYLANPEIRFASLGGAMIRARDMAFVSNDFANSGTLSAERSMTINVANTFQSSGQVSAQDIMISADTIDLSTRKIRITNTSSGQTSRFGSLLVNKALNALLGNSPDAKPEVTFRELPARPSTLVAGDTLVLRATGDITMAGTTIEAGKSAVFIAGGGITVGALELATEMGRRTGKNHNRRESLLYLTSSITSGGDITFLSSGVAAGQNDIVFEGADIYADGDIGIIAQGGDLVFAAAQNISFTDRASSRGGFFYKKVKRDQIFDISHKVTTITGQSITGVSALELVIEGTKFDVPGLPDGTLNPGALALISVNADLGFTAPTDIRAENHYVSRKILGGLITNTKDLRTLVTDSLGSIADIAGDMLINSGADFTATSVDFKVGGQFSTEVAGATYMLAAIDMDYRYLVEHRDNGIITTDIRSENLAERVTFNAITAAGGVNFDKGSPILFAGIRNALIDSAHPGAWLAGDKETGRMNLAGVFFGDKDAAPGKGGGNDYWRDD
ncbi:MAG: filamentous hemagglutinin N-terminal domain-containing protein, partial [Paracoccaceae bacterium]